MNKNILVVDPHGCRIHEGTTNVHARNSVILADYLGADLMYDSKTQSDMLLQKKYDKVIFVHASRYQHASKLSKILAKQENIDYYYVTNEYNLGENVALYFLYKNHGTQYDVISNYDVEQ